MVHLQSGLYCHCYMCAIQMNLDFVRSRASNAAGSDGWLAKKTELGLGLCRHVLCRCLQQSNLVQAVSSWTNCDDVCMCVVNNQFELLKFVFESVYVDFQCDGISLTFTISPSSTCTGPSSTCTGPSSS